MIVSAFSLNVIESSSLKHEPIGLERLLKGQYVLRWVLLSCEVSTASQRKLARSRVKEHPQFCSYQRINNDVIRLDKDVSHGWRDSFRGVVRGGRALLAAGVL